jgi:hypothetical protein
MPKLKLKDVTRYVEANIGHFHASRLAKVNSIKLKEILQSKNPYLFKAKNVTKASEIVQGILDAYLSSSEEGIFGNWLERLAIYINNLVYRGRKAGVDGIDLDFDKEDGQRYLVTIKSGPNWGNHDQIKKMIDLFNTARKRLKTSGAKVNVTCVNGCCYGKTTDTNQYKSTGDYYKVCGQSFWELISGDSQLYIRIIEPLGHEAEVRNKEFKKAYGKLINRITKEFLEDFCTRDGDIDWERLVQFNSGTEKKEKSKKDKAMYEVEFKGGTLLGGKNKAFKKAKKK